MKAYQRLLLLYFLPSAVLLLINIYISNHQVNWPIIKLLQYELFQGNIIAVLTIMWLIFIVGHDFYKYLQEESEKKQTELKETIKEKNNQLATKAGALIEKYSELHNYQIKETISYILKKFTSYNEIIHSAQLYKYSKTIFSNEAIIKVEYINGYTSEGVDINAIIQSYYKIPIQIYKDLNEILDIKKKLDALMSNSNLVEGVLTEASTELQIQNELQERIIVFIQNHKSSIDKKSFDELTESDSIMLSLFELLAEMLLTISPQDIDMHVGIRNF